MCMTAMLRPTSTPAPTAVQSRVLSGRYKWTDKFALNYNTDATKRMLTLFDTMK